MKKSSHNKSSSSSRAPRSRHKVERSEHRRIAHRGHPNFVDLTVVAEGESRGDEHMLTWDRAFVCGNDHNGKPIEHVKTVRFSCVSGEEAVLEVERYANKQNGDKYLATEIFKYPVRRFRIESLRYGCFMNESDIWTSDRPEEVGYYWFRNGLDPKPRLIKIKDSGSGVLCTDEDGDPSVEDEIYRCGQWCGPVDVTEPPD